MFFQCLFDEDVWQRFNTGNDKMSYLSTAFLKMSANCRPAPTEVQAQPGGGREDLELPREEVVGQSAAAYRCLAGDWLPN